MGKVVLLTPDNLRESIVSLSQNQAYGTSSETIPDNFGFGAKVIFSLYGFLKYRLDTIPPRSRIKNAKFLLTALNTITPGSGVYIAVLRRDGKWELDYNREIFRPSSSIVADTSSLFNLRMNTVGTFTRFRCEIRQAGISIASAGVSAAEATASAKFSFAIDDPTYGSLPYIKSYGQVLQTTSSGTLTNVLLNLLKTSPGPDHSLLAHIFAVDANFQPTGSPLATSDAVDSSSIGTSAADVQFDFNGVNQISIANNTYYAVLFSGGNFFSSSDYYIAKYDSDASDTDVNERAFVIASAGGFGVGSYPNILQFPFLYNQLTTTVNNPPFGTVIEKTIPAISSVGTVIEVTGIESIIQEWVDSPDFIEAHRSIGFIFDVGDNLWPGGSIEFSPCRLEIDYEPRRIYIT